MKDKPKRYYDVVIIGAGPAGLECAKSLINSNFSVLLINKDKIHDKVCCNYLPPHIFKFLSKSVTNKNFSHLDVDYKGINTYFNFGKNKIYVTERKILFNWYMFQIKKSRNINYLYGNSVSKIHENFIELQNGIKFGFKFLVGADGSSSLVRDYLGLSSERTMFAIQYPSKKSFKDIKIFIDTKVFPSAYGWIGVHKGCTYIGGGVSINDSKTFKKNLDNWIKKNNFDVKWNEVQACTLNCDYKGYKFGNVFLAGDAAGLVSALSGEGIYPAILSGRQVALDILGKKENLLRTWLINKKFQEILVKFMHNIPKNKSILDFLIISFGRIFYKLSLT